MYQIDWHHISAFLYTFFNGDYLILGGHKLPSTNSTGGGRLVVTYLKNRFLPSVSNLIQCTISTDYVEKLAMEYQWSLISGTLQFLVSRKSKCVQSLSVPCKCGQADATKKTFKSNYMALSYFVKKKT